MTTRDGASFASLAGLMQVARVDYALIGGHAVNLWLEPRFTADVDVTVVADAEGLARLAAVLSGAGYVRHREYGPPASGPDFMQWVSADGDVLEMQVAKTAFQHEVVRRAVPTADGARVATREDLIVLKLIADRGKDRVDLEGLTRLPGIDWAYVEHWATEWDVFDRLQRVRGS